MSNKYDETRLMLSDGGPAENVVGDGSYLLQQFDRQGNEIGRREGRNAITQGGMKYMARRVYCVTSYASAPMKWMQLGKGPTAADSTQTHILTPLNIGTLTGRQTVDGTTILAVTRTARLEHTWTATEFSAGGLVEAGLFNVISTAALTTSNIMLARFVFTLVNKSPADTLKITWNIRVS